MLFYPTPPMFSCPAWYELDFGNFLIRVGFWKTLYLHHSVGSFSGSDQRCNNVPRKQIISFTTPIGSRELEVSMKYNACQQLCLLNFGPETGISPMCNACQRNSRRCQRNTIPVSNFCVAPRQQKISFAFARCNTHTDGACPCHFYNNPVIFLFREMQHLHRWGLSVSLL